MKRFERFELLVGKRFVDIKKTTILIVGVGGVGSYALESLVRSGIENIIIIDNDTIDITNLNRQIIALEENIGCKKIEVAKKRALSINPKLHITTYDIFLNAENISILNNHRIDYIVDACDTISTKIALIKYALKTNCKIISSMGTGKRLDASQLEITTLKKTQNDPLAKIIRKKLREENLSLNIPVIWSREEPVKIESKTIASCSYVPATAGLLITSYIINDILKN